MPASDRIVRFNTGRSRTTPSSSTIYHKIAERPLPAQLRISVNGAGWREPEINRCIANPVAWRPEGERGDG